MFGDGIGRQQRQYARTGLAVHIRERHALVRPVILPAFLTVRPVAAAVWMLLGDCGAGEGDHDERDNSATQINHACFPGCGVWCATPSFELDGAFDLDGETQSLDR